MRYAPSGLPIVEDSELRRFTSQLMEGTTLPGARQIMIAHASVDSEFERLMVMTSRLYPHSCAELVRGDIALIRQSLNYFSEAPPISGEDVDLYLAVRKRQDVLTMATYESDSVRFDENRALAAHIASHARTLEGVHSSTLMADCAASYRMLADARQRH